MGEGKADVNKAKNDGTTPLFVAAQYGYAEVAESLLRGRAHVDKPKNDGATPLFIAGQNGHAELAKLLLQGRADMAHDVDATVVAAGEGAGEGIDDFEVDAGDFIVDA